MDEQRAAEGAARPRFVIIKQISVFIYTKMILYIIGDGPGSRSFFSQTLHVSLPAGEQFPVETFFGDMVQK